MMVSYGNASGAVPPVTFVVVAKGSLFVTQPTLAGYTGTRARNLSLWGPSCLRLLAPEKYGLMLIKPIHWQKRRSAP